MAIDIVVQGAIRSGKPFALLLISSQPVCMTLTLKVDGADRPFILDCQESQHTIAARQSIAVEGRLECRVSRWGSARLGSVVEVVGEAGPLWEMDSGTVVVAAAPGA